jgi:sulfur-carrier protein
MSVTVNLPTVLRTAANGHKTVSLDGSTVGEVLEKLGAEYPGVTAQVLAADGTLHRFLNVYLNDDDVRYLGGLGAAVTGGDEITLLPAVAGGN